MLVNREGKKYDILNECKQNPRGTNLPRASRFGVMPFYDRGTGQSVFIGPGSYNADEAANKLAIQPCPTVIVNNLIRIIVFRNRCNYYKGKKLENSTT